MIEQDERNQWHTMKNAEVATHNGTQWKNTEVDYTQAYNYFALDYMDCYWGEKM